MINYITISVITQIVYGNILDIDRPIIKVQEGPLRGIREQNIDGNSYFYAFRGIPYATPPIGDLRFKDPKPVEAWTSVRDAEKFGNVCAQKELYSEQVMGSDDCLYLNVYTMDINPDEPRAVMVWIHGGGFIWGSGNDDFFGPDYLVLENIVLVTINYRLDIFGFLNLDDEEAPGNQGLKDQVMALKWVKQNIVNFGGDSNRVTIFGQSAGGASVHYLTLSPLAQGLFHRAILQSGVATNSWAYVSTFMKEETVKVVRKLGAEITDTKQLIEYLRNVDTLSLIDVLQSVIYPKSAYVNEKVYAPSVDSKSANPFLNISVIEAAKYGIKIPHIIGYTSHESVFILARLKDEDYAEIEANQNTQLISAKEKEFLKKLNVSVSDVKNFFMGNERISRENAQLFVNLATANQYVFNIQDTIETDIITPDVLSSTSRYYYKFNYYDEEKAVVQQLFNTDLEGTAHTEELYYLFNAKILSDRGIKQVTSYPTERTIQKRFLGLWTNFAKTGNPNLDTADSTSIEWKPVNSSNIYNCLEISNDLNMIMEPNILNKFLEQVHD